MLNKLLIAIWYTLTIKVNKHIIELRNSLKLLPFSVKQIGKSFKTKHQKLDMEYVGYRYAGCNITDKEKQYIANDVLVVKEALEQLFNDEHDKLTIGSCCMEEYKKTKGEKKNMITRLENLYYRYKAKKHEKVCRHLCCFCKHKYYCNFFTKEY